MLRDKIESFAEHQFVEVNFIQLASLLAFFLRQDVRAEEGFFHSNRIRPLAVFLILPDLLVDGLKSAGIFHDTISVRIIAKE